MFDNFSIEKHMNCPQCGAALALYFKHTKLIQCESCKSSIFLENDAVQSAGDSAVLAPELSLIQLNTPFLYKQKSYLPIGMIRYSYGRGFWEEWWIKDTQNNAYWLSIDEGDLVLEEEIPVAYSPEVFNSLYLKQRLEGGWIVTEKGTATCEGFSGSLPKKVSKGSTYSYVHLSGKNAVLQTIEKSQETMHAYSGVWINPFDIGKIS